ncbi:hypothetical protein [Microcoleus sp. PH2017_05_CCC_O_A]|uniref:hypothetical protein n=1 Tax=Microcoleus sp. PH2017_05_CCC_O_A TaxID=2798816 RepID=UPI001D291428|nr:hypothetical protein [Microcoleus sp. PH2017_05_CCC_O_A]MCC3439604.1 hypothetical protein [Microcoleus sp. PH2017_05_CCC_O_A]
MAVDSWQLTVTVVLSPKSELRHLTVDIYTVYASRFAVLFMKLFVRIAIGRL